MGTGAKTSTMRLSVKAMKAKRYKSRRELERIEMSAKNRGRTEMTPEERVNFENKVQQQLEKASLALDKSVGKFKSGLNEYDLDTVYITLSFSGKILGAGAELDVEMAFTKKKP